MGAWGSYSIVLCAQNLRVPFYSHATPTPPTGLGISQVALVVTLAHNSCQRGATFLPPWEHTRATWSLIGSCPPGKYQPSSTQMQTKHIQCCFTKTTFILWRIPTTKGVGHFHTLVWVAICIRADNKWLERGKDDVGPCPSLQPWAQRACNRNRFACVLKKHGGFHTGQRQVAIVFGLTLSINPNRDLRILNYATKS